MNYFDLKLLPTTFCMVTELNWTGQLHIISTGNPHEIMGNF